MNLLILERGSLVHHQKDIINWLTIVMETKNLIKCKSFII